MLSKKFFSKVLNTASALALSGVFLGFSTSSAVLAMDCFQDDDCEFQKSTLSLTESIEEEEYDLRASLAESPFNCLNDEMMLPIMTLSLGEKKELPLAVVSKYFHNLSFDKTLNRIMTIKTIEAFEEVLASRNPFRAKNLEQGIISDGYELPYPRGMHLALCEGSFFDSERKKICSFSYLTPDNFKEFLDKYTSLTHLDLENNRLQLGGAKILGECLLKNTSLISLNLKKNRLENTGVHFIAEALSNNTVLRSLRFVGNIIGNQDGELDFEEFKRFTDAFSKNSTLTHLYLENTDDPCMIPSILTTNSYLTSLYVSNHVGLSGERLKNICDALAVNCSLKELGFSTKADQSPTPQWMSDDDVQIFSESLKQSSSLTLLDLSGTEIKPEDAKTITQVCTDKKIQLKWNNKERKVVPVGLSHITRRRGLRVMYGGIEIGNRTFGLPLDGNFLWDNSRSREFYKKK